MSTHTQACSPAVALPTWICLTRRAGALLGLCLEDLVSDPRGELTRLCDHIRLPFHVALLEHDLGRAHAGRWCREALFFLVWSCPQSVLSANLCELAGIA